MMMKPMIKNIPSKLKPKILTITKATSQDTFMKSANPPMTHRWGGSEPSSGIVLDSQTKEETFKSNLPPDTSCCFSDTLG